MKLKDPRNGRSAARTFALASPIAMLLLVLLALVLFPANESGAGDQRGRTVGVEDSQDGRHDAPPPGPEAVAGKEQIVESMRDLMSRKEFDCERTVRLLLGLDGDDDIDIEQIPRLLGLDEGDAIDCEQIVRLLLGTDEGAVIDNEQIVRLLLGIDEGDDIDREQIVDLLESLGEGD